MAVSLKNMTEIGSTRLGVYIVFTKQYGSLHMLERSLILQVYASTAVTGVGDFLLRESMS